jgi:hypothetical protein
MGESLMDIDHWYRCSVCGYRYTPQQVVALLELLASRAGESASQRHDPERIPCRKKGCEGLLVPTEEPFRTPMR